MNARRSLSISIALACLAASASVASPGRGAPSGRFIVVLNDDAGEVSLVAERHARRFGAEVRSVFGQAIRGYAADIPLDRVEELRRHRRVDYIEEDVPLTIDRRRRRNRRRRAAPTPTPTPAPPAVSSQTLPWGIDRVGADTSSTQAGDGSGSVGNVNVFVIDTGVANHPDLNLVRNVNLLADGIQTDCNGHGTHVAGTIAARDNDTDVVGVAPGAPVTGVRAFDCDGKAFASDVLRGIEWVTANAVKPAVANMSIIGPTSSAIDDAIRGSVASGVTYALAAGNGGSNGCATTSAHLGSGIDNGIMTVAATDAADRESAFSNFGSCIDLWAPGSDVLSLSATGGTTIMSGTSMAAPHVAGGAALYLCSFPAASPAAVEAALRSHADIPGTLSKDGRPVARLFVGRF